MSFMIVWSLFAMHCKNIKSTNVAEKDEDNICKDCLVRRRSDIVHCDLCGCCVEGYDHHCGVVGICVGDKTFKPFILFIFYCGMLMIAAALTGSALEDAGYGAKANKVQ